MDTALIEEVILWERNHKRRYHDGRYYYAFTPVQFPPNYHLLLHRITHIDLSGSLNDPEEMSALYSLCNLESVFATTHRSVNVLAEIEWSRFTKLRKVVIRVPGDTPPVTKWHFNGCEQLRSVELIGGGTSTALPSLCTVTSLIDADIRDTSKIMSADVDFSALTKLERLNLSGVYSQFPQGLSAMSNLVQFYIHFNAHRAIEKVVIPREIENSNIDNMIIASEVPIEWNVRDMQRLTRCCLYIPNILEAMDDVIQSSPQLQSLFLEPLVAFEIE